MYVLIGTQMITEHLLVEIGHREVSKSATKNRVFRDFIKFPKSGSNILFFLLFLFLDFYNSYNMAEVGFRCRSQEKTHIRSPCLKISIYQHQFNEHFPIRLFCQPSQIFIYLISEKCGTFLVRTQVFFTCATNKNCDIFLYRQE